LVNAVIAATFLPDDCSLAVLHAPEQVVQLRQRDRAKLDTFSINVQRYSQNHAQNCIFGPTYGGIWGNISTSSEGFNAKNFVAKFHRENISFTCITANYRF